MENANAARKLLGFGSKETLVSLQTLLVMALIIPLASASVTINEIMYHPTDSIGGSSAEWIELYNPSDAAVSMDGWRIADPSNHTISGDTISIPPSGYLIVSKTAFFPDFSSYYGISAPAKAGFSLNNNGEQINLLDQKALRGN